jgi:hypothetical protein
MTGNFESIPLKAWSHQSTVRKMQNHALLPGNSVELLCINFNYKYSIVSSFCVVFTAAFISVTTASVYIHYAFIFYCMFQPFGHRKVCTLTLAPLPIPYWPMLTVGTFCVVGLITLGVIQYTSILYYLCAESTATRPVTDTAECYQI